MERTKRRAGRPPKENRDELRNVAIGVSVTAAEHDRITKDAIERGGSASAYLRALGLGERRRAPQAAMELFALADRVEQLASAALPDEVRAEVKALAAAIDDVARRFA